MPQKLGVFELDGSQYINVDTTTPEGIRRAGRLGLATSGLADVIISPRFHAVTSQIFNPSNPGRMVSPFFGCSPSVAP